MQTQINPLAALAVALALISVNAQAIPLTISGSATLLSGVNRSVSNNNTTPDQRTQNTNIAVSQFNSNNGVLMSLTATLTPGSNTTWLRADGNNPARGTATVNEVWSGSGGLNAAGTLNTVTKSGNADGTDNSWNSLSQTINNVTNLNNWVGTGNVATSLSTTLIADRDSNTLTANIGSSGANNTETLTNLNAGYSVTYDYLLHADASFAAGSSQTVLNLDFGSVNLGDLAPLLNFSIFNLSGERVGLDLDSFSGFGDTSVLGTNLGLFAGLTASGENGFQAFLDTSVAGNFNATYLLTLSDADIGASSSRYSYDNHLTLNLTGNVIRQPSASPVAVPVPGILSLFGIGLLGFIGLRRRKVQ